MPARLLVSFSGGETSGYMTKWILDELSYAFDEIAVVFANTGEEDEETLRFVHNCDRHFSFNTVWIEGVQFLGERRAAGHKVVTFETAARKGEPFEAAIRKYGIPNQKFKDCTRALKRKPIESWAREAGWGTDHLIAIGIRADEMDRISSDAEKRRIIYPFAKGFPRTKPQVNSWWAKQPFRLNLKGYQGNCKWCWKKSDRKLLTIIGENPSYFDFPRRMEKEYGKVGPEFRHDPATRHTPLSPDYQRKFFRGSRSTGDLFALYEQKKGKFPLACDDHLIFDEELDVGSGCEESCEVYGEDDSDVEE